MRIISGTHKGRVIHAPKNLPVRPTTDFAKESLFNILNNYYYLNGLHVLDLFCGTGNITYEFASRGCAAITSVDSSYHCYEFVKKTSIEFKMQSIHVIKANVFSFLKTIKASYDIIFCDPPYDLKNISELPDIIFQQNLVNADGCLIVEHGEQTDFSLHPNLKEHRKYGNVNFSIFVNRM